MRLLIASPEGNLLDVTGVDWVNIRLADGTPLSIYANHAPLVALHAAGTLRYRMDERVFEQSVTDGVLSIAQNTIKCLVKSIVPESSDTINQKEKNEE
jgi:F0F1-type ATP synthase epsilon subunit